MSDSFASAITSAIASAANQAGSSSSGTAPVSSGSVAAAAQQAGLSFIQNEVPSFAQAIASLVGSASSSTPSNGTANPLGPVDMQPVGAQIGAEIAAYAANNMSAFASLFGASSSAASGSGAASLSSLIPGGIGAAMPAVTTTGSGTPAFQIAIPSVGTVSVVPQEGGAPLISLGT